MKIKAEVDLTEFYSDYGDSFTQIISEEIITSLKKEAIKQLKASPEYKKIMNTLQEKVLAAIKAEL